MKVPTIRAGVTVPDDENVQISHAAIDLLVERAYDLPDDNDVATGATDGRWSNCVKYEGDDDEAS